MALILSVLFSSAAIACRSGESMDAGDVGPCWPIDTAHEEGEVELGTGENAFESMPETLQLITGTQNGWFLVVHSRMKGMEPGDPQDFFSPTNPGSKFTAILADDSEMTRPCPSTIAYVPGSDGWLELKNSQIVELFPENMNSTLLFDTNVRLILEVIDSKGRYARDEKVVFAKAPLDAIDAGAGD